MKASLAYAAARAKVVALEDELGWARGGARRELLAGRLAAAKAAAGKLYGAARMWHGAYMSAVRCCA